MMRRLHALGIAAIAAVACVPFVDRAQAQEQVYFGNLHSHTSYSDGSGTPEQAYRHARYTARIDFLAIPDHNPAGAENGTVHEFRIDIPDEPKCPDDRR